MNLRQYQIDISDAALHILNDFGLVYLAMQVRTGKTLTSLEIAQKWGAKSVLFVTKKKAISSIIDDQERMEPDYFLKVINYEQLHTVLAVDYDFIIADEHHCNSGFPLPSKRTILLKAICKGKPVVLLSGTPSPESFSQLYHQLWVSERSPFNMYKNFYAWHKEYGVPHKKYVFNRDIPDYSKTKTEKIQLDTAHLFLTYTQEEAGFESLVEEEVLYVPMSEKVKWAADRIKKDKLFRTKDGKVVLADTAVKEMQKTHQICSGTVKAEDGTAIIFDTTKADFIKERFKGQKIAIFYKYIAEGLVLRSKFSNVFDDPIEFNKAEGEAIFISQVQSGREGINLSSAEALVMYNIDFSAVSYWQSRARIQTKDRKEASKVYWIFTNGGIEDRILAMVHNKKDFTLAHYKKIH